MLLRYQIPSYADTLSRRLKEFDLEKSFVRYPLLVQFDWLRPAFHVPVPDTWMERYLASTVSGEWTDGVSSHWAARFNSSWHIEQDEIGRDEWFVHPLFRRGNTRAEFFEHAKPINTPHDWHRKQLPDGHEYVAAFDYFYEWQLFRFADIVDQERRLFPHFWLPGAHANLLQHAAQSTVDEFDRVANVPRWHAWGEAFTRLAYFVEFDRVFKEYVFYRDIQAQKHSSDRVTQRKQDLANARLGAKQLLSWLGTTVEQLELSVESCFLTLAQDWRHRNYHADQTTQTIWRALQLQVDALLRWLWLVSDREDFHYLQKHSYSFFGEQTWARLEDVVPYAEWKAARSFSKYIAEVAARYPSAKFSSLGNFRPSPSDLLSLRMKQAAFADYLHAIDQFVEDSTHRKDDDPFRKRSRESWYRLVAVLSEILFEVIEEPKTDSKTVRKAIRGAKDPAPLCVVAERLAGKGTEFNRVKNQGKGAPHENYLEALANGIRKATDKNTLILYFTLSIHAARNGQAHAYGREHEFLSAEWASPIFDALVYFVPWALIQLDNQIATKRKKLD
jgi:hypothetical protein